jgi:peroxiredoxin
MKSLEDKREVLASLNCVPVGISVDSVPCKRAWASSLTLKHTPLLCDFWPQGEVVFVKIYPVHSVPDIEEIIGIFQELH